jgi:hypothetical protein
MSAGKCGKANQSSDGTLPPDSEAAVLVGRSLQGVAREWNTNGVKTVRDRGAAALRARQDELATLFATGDLTWPQSSAICRWIAAGTSARPGAGNAHGVSWPSS